ncbi:MAG: DUF3795 domain-containing protein [Methanomassiliicoccales archaeon]
MSDDNIAYCGLYCRLCVENSLLPLKARELLNMMEDEGYGRLNRKSEELRASHDIFLRVLNELADMKCTCRDGGGFSECKVRACARERGLFVCMECEDHPCDKWNEVAKSYPFLIIDAFRYQDVGKETWAEEQEERVSRGFNYWMMRRRCR